MRIFPRARAHAPKIPPPPPWAGGSYHATLTLALLLVVASVAGPACRRTPTAPPPVVESPADAAPAYLAVRPAIRCAECHSSLHREWEGSAHARAETSPLYQAMRAAAAPELRCDRCHAPLKGLVDPADLVAREGVTCEVCHAIHAVGENGAFEMALAENVQRGTLCDARDHNFHKMGCSPMHGESRFCAACHTLQVGTLEIFTEVADWKSGPYADLLDCQDCHMPDRTDEVATGSPPREDVSHHGFRGADGRLFSRALTGRVEARLEGEKLLVEVAVKNANAGHRVPGGLPGRQVILRVRALGAAGETLATAERIYQRVLVDERGVSVPFYLGVREKSDNRLRPKERRVEHFALDAPAAALVRVEVVRRAMAPHLAAAVGAPPQEEAILSHAEVAPGAAAEWSQ